MGALNKFERSKTYRLQRPKSIRALHFLKLQILND